MRISCSQQDAEVNAIFDEELGTLGQSGSLSPFAPCSIAATRFVVGRSLATTTIQKSHKRDLMLMCAK